MEEISWLFDNLGRVTSITNNLGTFGIPSFDGITSRPTRINYPNGQAAVIDYYGNGQDRRLEAITNLSSGTVPTSVLSRFSYTAYTRDGQIQQMERTLDSGQTNRYVFGYDTINQLRSATDTNVNTGVVTASSYGYDAAGNRTSERVNQTGRVSQFNELNELIDSGGGNASVLVSGSTSEPARVNVNGKTVDTDSANKFTSSVTSTGASTALTITATDFSTNANSTTRNWSFASSNAASAAYGYVGGNLTSRSDTATPQQYGWDGENRLKTITIGAQTWTFVYDGFGRRVKELVNGTATRTWVWSGLELIEERDAAGTTVVKRFYPQGEQWVGGANAGNYFYTFDHLGSIREMTNSAAAVVARYDYTPFGIATKTTGSLDSSFTFTGYFAHAASGLVLAPYRAYAPELAKWLSRDSLGEEGGLNLYGYVYNDPINLWDPYGLYGYAESFSDWGALYGAGAAMAGSVAVDAATGGLNILATPAEVALGGLVGGGIGYGIGSALDWLTSHSDSESCDAPKDTAGDQLEGLEAAQAAARGRDKRPSIQDKRDEWDGAKGRPKQNAIRSGGKSGQRARYNEYQ